MRKPNLLTCAAQSLLNRFEADDFRIYGKMAIIFIFRNRAGFDLSVVVIGVFFKTRRQQLRILLAAPLRPNIQSG
jgi:hypothetical protein